MIRSIQPSGCGWICALDDHDDGDDHEDDNGDDDIYIMMQFCLSRKMITFLEGLSVCL